MILVQASAGNARDESVPDPGRFVELERDALSDCQSLNSPMMPTEGRVGCPDREVATPVCALGAEELIETRVGALSKEVGVLLSEDDLRHARMLGEEHEVEKRQIWRHGHPQGEVLSHAHAAGELTANARRGRLNVYSVFGGMSR